ncbi:MAG TPA: hypothetical protein DEX33_06195, partial [Cellvibrionales bacterium]|nr:hypothetical protein [Cellvibrionales bacterium]
FWLMGQPSPNWLFKLTASDSDSDKNNDKTNFTQQGWQVQYTEFMPNQPHRLPKKIVAQYGRLKLRVAIHQWQLNGGSEQP